MKRFRVLTIGDALLIFYVFFTVAVIIYLFIPPMFGSVPTSEILKQHREFLPDFPSAP